MIPVVRFYRYDGGNYHPFSLLHYLAIYSFAVCNPEYTIKFYCNTEVVGGWFRLLKDKLGSRLELVKIDDVDTTKYDYVSHYIDCLKIQHAYELGGLFLDTDYISTGPVSKIIDYSKINISDEYDRVTKEFMHVIISFLYCEPNDPIVKGWYEESKNYQKGKDWTYYPGDVPTQSYLTNRDRFNTISSDDIGPWSAYRLDINELFLHNHEVLPMTMFHVSESVTWMRHFEYMDIEHIMTVDTTFTKLVRRFVVDLWDEKTQKSKFKLCR